MSFVYALRWAAVVVMVCGVALASATRRWRGGVSGGVCAGALLAADGVLGRRADPRGFDVATADATSSFDPTPLVHPSAQFAGTGAVAVAFGLALVVVACAVAAGHLPGRRGAEGPEHTRPLVVFAVLAAVTAPVTAISAPSNDVAPYLFGGRPIAFAVVSVALAVLAVACGLAAARALTVRRLVAAVTLLVPAAVVLALAAVTHDGSGLFWGAVLSAGPLGVGAVACAWARRPGASAWLAATVAFAAASPVIGGFLLFLLWAVMSLFAGLAGAEEEDTVVLLSPQAAFAALAVGVWLIRSGLGRPPLAAPPTYLRQARACP